MLYLQHSSQCWTTFLLKHRQQHLLQLIESILYFFLQALRFSAKARIYLIIVASLQYTLTTLPLDLAWTLSGLVISAATDGISTWHPISL